MQNRLAIINVFFVSFFYFHLWRKIRTIITEMGIIMEFVANLRNSAQEMITRLMRSLEYIQIFHLKEEPWVGPVIEHLQNCKHFISTAKSWQCYNTIWNTDKFTHQMHHFTPNCCVRGLVYLFARFKFH